MTSFDVKLNTPGPYFSLNKGLDIPEVSTISALETGSESSIENDVSIFAVHKCIPKMHLTRVVGTGDLTSLPGASFKEGLGTISRFIKLGNVNIEELKVVEDSIEDPEKTFAVLCGDDMEKNAIRYFSDSKKLSTSGKTLVITLEKCLDYFPELSSTSSNNDHYLSLAKALSNQAGSGSVLILNTVPGSNCHTYYSSKADDHLHIQGKSPISMVASAVSSAIIANIAHGFGNKEAIYGALEFVQNSIILAGIDNGHPNYMYAVSVPLEHMMNDECFEAHEIRSLDAPSLAKPEFNSFYEYLIQHPLVKPSWESYINHDFVRQIADGVLDIDKFRFFIEQDYSYLVDYGRVHCIAGSKAPELESMEEELVIVGRIREEMGQHEQRLKEVFGVQDDSYFKNIERGTALKNYSRYFNDIANRGSWEELVAALTPCMMGYGAAAMKFKNNVKAEKGGMYEQWIDIYSCNNYENGMKLGEKILNHIAKKSSADDLERLAKIYGEVCALETQFWDAALAR